MSAEDNQVFATGASVLLAPSAELDQVADQSVPHGALQMHHAGSQAHLVSDANLESVLLGDRQELVGLRQSPRKRLFCQDMSATAQSRQGHFKMLLGPT